MSKLFPDIEPYDTGYLDVSNEDSIYYEQSGNKKGIPVFYLHGGPGDGADPKHRKYFNPDKYRIVIHDQRGSGRSKPLGQLKTNTTNQLVDDIEKLRSFLEIEQFVLVGGSWGSTLALNYAIKYSQRVSKLVLWSIALFSNDEYSWTLERGANILFPDLWEKYADNSNLDLLEKYYKDIFSDDLEIRNKAIAAKLNWDLGILSLAPSGIKVDPQSLSPHMVAAVQISMHYFKNKGFMAEDFILKNVKVLEDIETHLIQGRYDMLTPAIAAWRLHKVLPKSTLKMVTAGHRTSESEILENILAHFN